MHELALARSIVAIADAAARHGGAAAVRAVGVRVGAIAGVEPEALCFGFEVARAGTRLASARLELERVALACRCERCGVEFETADPHGVARCPECGVPSGRVLRGRELEVAWLEVA